MVRVRDAVWMCRVQNAKFRVTSLAASMYGIVLASENACICFSQHHPFGWLNDAVLRACALPTNCITVAHLRKSLLLDLFGS